MLTRPTSGEGEQGFRTRWLFHVALLLGKNKEAEEILRSDPQEMFTQGWLSPVPKSFLFGQLYLRVGDMEKARANFEKARPSIEQTVQQRPLEGAWHLVLAEVYAGLGRKEDAVDEAKRATEIMPESKDPWASLGMLDGLAEIYVMVGATDRALPIIEHSLASPGGMYIEQLRISPFWAQLRGNPRFEKTARDLRVSVAGRFAAKTILKLFEPVLERRGRMVQTENTLTACSRGWCLRASGGHSPARKSQLINRKLRERKSAMV